MATTLFAIFLLYFRAIPANLFLSKVGQFLPGKKKGRRRASLSFFSGSTNPGSA
jgi:hypothetical protein